MADRRGKVKGMGFCFSMITLADSSYDVRNIQDMYDSVTHNSHIQS
jgi:hypothetical protein